YSGFAILKRNSYKEKYNYVIYWQIELTGGRTLRVRKSATTIHYINRPAIACRDTLEIPED
ncbi:TPA: hypothetical protein ACNHD5_003266, partial [Escherichia coli]